MVVCREGRRRVPAEPCCGARLPGDVAPPASAAAVRALAEAACYLPLPPHLGNRLSGSLCGFPAGSLDSWPGSTIAGRPRIACLSEMTRPIMWLLLLKNFDPVPLQSQ